MRQPKTVVPRLAQDTEEVIRQTSHLPGVSRRNMPPTLPASGRPELHRQNVQAARYYDVQWVIPIGQNVVVLPANEGRTYLLIIVIGANAAQVAIDKPAAANVGMPLAGAAVGAVSGGFWEPLVPPVGSINIFSAAGTTVVVTGD
jgi:hypothetical protein